jgi:RNA-directed DNA polymerase
VLKRSKAAKTLALRQVSQDNRGKRTAGIDGVKNLNPAERLAMASKLTLEGKTAPVRRIWIPKPGKDETRPLGLPTMLDRARQALAKMALEPEWEAVFEPNSYGFRPGRSCHDAIEQIHTAMRKEKYILEADIKGCFDNIAHDALLDKINDPELRPILKKWLKAGIIDQGSSKKRIRGRHRVESARGEAHSGNAQERRSCFPHSTKADPAGGGPEHEPV